MKLHTVLSDRPLLLVLVFGFLLGGCASPSLKTEGPNVGLQKAIPTGPLTQPRYPDDSRRKGHQGVVAVEVLVGKDGVVKDARIAVTSGHKDIDASTLVEVSDWRFVPAKINEKRIAQWSLFSIPFHLPGHPMPQLRGSLEEAVKLMNQRNADLVARAMAEPSS